MKVSFIRALILGAAFSILATGLLNPQTASARTGLITASVDYIFGGPVSFVATYDPSIPVKEALVLFRTQDESQTIVNPASITEGYLEYVHEQTSYPLRPFARVDYWFQLTYSDGTVLTTDIYSFHYEDNRFDWQEISRAPFHVHWYDGDTAFAQGILDVAYEGLKKAQSLLPLPDPQEIHIYVYATSEELQATRRLARREGVAGHADVDLSVMIVSLPNLPERRLEAERQVPHELMHILLYQAVDRGYENFPTWLNEGLASLAELYPNPDYQTYLESAHERQALIPLKGLCAGFPLEVSDFILSYAQSAYFTRYLYRNYGSNSIDTLVKNYANGLDCERGFETTFGVTLANAEELWLKDYFGAGSTPMEENFVVNETWPWFALLFVIVGLPFAAVLPLYAKQKPNRSMGES